MRNYFSIPEDEKLYIYVGQFSQGRGLIRIVEAFTEENIHSHVVFLGSGQLDEELKTHEQNSHNIHIHPPVSHEKVVEVTSSADCGLCLIENVSLSDYFCLPNKLFEYCFGGLPVIASDFPDIRSLVTEAGLGICLDMQSESLADKITEFERNDFQFNVADLSSFSWKSQEKRLVSLYQDL